MRRAGNHNGRLSDGENIVGTTAGRVPSPVAALMRHVPRRVDKWRYNADRYVQVSHMDTTTVIDHAARVIVVVLAVP
jgi:hypothetical protein